MNTEIQEKINLAIVAYKLEKFDEAETLFEQIIDKSSEKEEILIQIFKIYYKFNDFEKAIKYISRAIELNQTPDYCNILGNIYYDQKDYTKAKECFLKVLKVNPYNSDCLFKLGVACSSNLELDEAIEYFNNTISLEPNDPINYYNLGLTYKNAYKFDKSIECLVKAIKLKPNYPEAVTLLGKVFFQLGNFTDGWKLYEGRFYKSEGVDPIQSTKPEWDGSSLKNKTIYIQREQGFGDCIMYARFIPWLSSLGKKVLFKVYPELEQLFRDSSLPAELVSESTPIESLEFDTHFSLASLARIYNVNEENMPCKNGYLKSNPDKVKKYRELYFNNDKFKIGIVWHCKTTFQVDKHRSIPDVSVLFPLVQIPNTKIYSLQKGVGVSQLDSLPENMDIVNLGSTFNDFSDTAAAIENLDLVVTVDTSIVHLAGALGKDTIVMLDYLHDWKWMLDRDDCIWYKKMKLFKQDKPYNWEYVIDNVVQHIKFCRSNTSPT